MKTAENSTIQPYETKSQYRIQIFQMRWKSNQDIYRLLFHIIWNIYLFFLFSNFRGGLFGGYCGPPSFKGVCCVFVSGNCGKRFTEKISYFTNKSFPKSDIEPYQCLLSIKPLQNTCWVCVFKKT